MKSLLSDNDNLRDAKCVGCPDQISKIGFLGDIKEYQVALNSVLRMDGIHVIHLYRLFLQSVPMRMPVRPAELNAVLQWFQS